MIDKRTYAEFLKGYCLHKLDAVGSLDFTLIGRLPSGSDLVMVAPFRDDDQKQVHLQVARCFFDFAKVTTYALVAEQWMSKPQTKDPAKLKELPRPSQDPNREEIVGIFIADRSGESYGISYPLLRAPDGGFQDLGAGQEMPGVSGTMVELLTDRFDADPQAAEQLRPVWQAFVAKGGVFTAFEFCGPDKPAFLMFDTATMRGVAH